MWLGLTQLLDKMTCQEPRTSRCSARVSPSLTQHAAHDISVVIAGGARLLCLLNLIWIQSSTPAPTSGLLIARACHQDAGPGIHLVLSPGLLQLTAVLHQRRLYYATCSRCRTRLCTWSLVLNGVIISPRCSGSCIGCLLASESLSRLRVCSINR